MLITRISAITGVVRTLDLNITKEEWEEYEKGDKNIVYLFPKLSHSDKEFILSGITEEEWNQYMLDENE